MVTAIKGGFQVALGSTGGHRQVSDAVQAKAVGELLGQLRNRPDFQEARGRFEFRLVERDGEAFLQLKERNWASKLKGALNIRSDARAQERLGAMQAINSRFGLGINSLQTGAAVTGTQARSFVGEHGGALIEALDAKANGELRIGEADVIRTPEQLREGLSAMHVRATSEGEVNEVQSPLDQLFDRKVLTTIMRATVSIGADGSLNLDGRSAGSGKRADKLETVVSFFEKASGLQRDDPGFKSLLRHATRNDHFVFAAQTANAMGDAVKQRFGVSGASLDIAGQNKISFDGERFRIEQRCAGTMIIGGLDFNPGSLVGGQPIGREQSFELLLSDLVKPDFDIARDAQNLTAKDLL